MLVQFFYKSAYYEQNRKEVIARSKEWGENKSDSRPTIVQEKSCKARKFRQFYGQRV